MTIRLKRRGKRADTAKEDSPRIRGGIHMVRTIATALAALVLTSAALWAEDKKEEKKDEPPSDAKKLGSDEADCHTHARAGYPLLVSKRAQPTDVPGYGGYWVGGGSLKYGGSVAPPSPDLGTW